jgi:hypothetical protein
MQFKRKLELPVHGRHVEPSEFERMYERRVDDGDGEPLELQIEKLRAVNQELLGILINIEGVTNDRMVAALARAAIKKAEG